MKHTIKLTLAAIAVLTFCLSGYSQKKTLKKADEAFEARQYYHAITFYKQAFDGADKTKKPLILYRMGYSSQKINDYKAAEAYYQKSIASNFDDPAVYMHLAEVL